MKTFAHRSYRRRAVTRSQSRAAGRARQALACLCSRRLSVATMCLRAPLRCLCGETPLRCYTWTDGCRGHLFFARFRPNASRRRLVGAARRIRRGVASALDVYLQADGRQQVGIGMSRTVDGRSAHAGPAPLLSHHHLLSQNSPLPLTLRDIALYASSSPRQLRRLHGAHAGIATHGRHAVVMDSARGAQTRRFTNGLWRANKRYAAVCYIASWRASASFCAHLLYLYRIALDASPRYQTTSGGEGRRREGRQRGKAGGRKRQAHRRTSNITHRARRRPCARSFLARPLLPLCSLERADAGGPSAASMKMAHGDAWRPAWRLLWMSALL